MRGPSDKLCPNVSGSWPLAQVAGRIACGSGSPACAFFEAVLFRLIELRQARQSKPAETPVAGWIVQAAAAASHEPLVIVAGPISGAAIVEVLGPLGGDPGRYGRGRGSRDEKDT